MKTDRAHGVAGLLEGRYAGCEKVRPTLDDPDTRTKGACYAASERERARAPVRRVEFCYMPEHGSWLNAAECELSAMTRQCPGRRRIGDLCDLRTQRPAA
ncbi:MAG: hypothetical protein OXH99_22235 [Bryobacterales bacterium]|nr:hypothetical protein [Bryobacterales bacterium]